MNWSVGLESASVLLGGLESSAGKDGDVSHSGDLAYGTGSTAYDTLLLRQNTTFIQLVSYHKMLTTSLEVPTLSVLMGAATVVPFFWLKRLWSTPGFASTLA